MVFILWSFCETGELIRRFARVKDFVKEHDVDCEFTERMTLDVVLNEEFKNYCQTAMREAKEHGVDVSHIKYFEGEDAKNVRSLMRDEVPLATILILITRALILAYSLPSRYRSLSMACGLSQPIQVMLCHSQTQFVPWGQVVHLDACHECHSSPFFW